MIQPSSDARRSGSAAWETRNVPTTFTDSTRSQCAGVTASTSWSGISVVTAALLTSPSIRPQRSGRGSHERLPRCPGRRCRRRRRAHRGVRRRGAGRPLTDRAEFTTTDAPHAGQPACDRLADTARRSGHDDDAVSQVEAAVTLTSGAVAARPRAGPGARRAERIHLLARWRRFRRWRSPGVRGRRRPRGRRTSDRTAPPTSSTVVPMATTAAADGLEPGEPARRRGRSARPS